MKTVVSVSIGSSTRDHSVRVRLLGEDVLIERRGTDGDIKKAIRLIAELDGRVDAFGLGGIDLYLVAKGRRYVIRDALRMARAARKSPVVDGSGLKHTLERRVVRWLEREGGIMLRGRRVLMVSAVDRFGMAESFAEAGADMIMGDLIFGLGIPIALHSLDAVDRLARLMLPILCRLPFTLLYPTGEKQENISGGAKHKKYFDWAEIVAGDFHFIRRYMPDDLSGKVILTNTVTAHDVHLLRQKGVRTLVTTTPELNGRSFGTNVMEAVLVALSGRSPGQLTPADYEDMLDRLDFRPRVEQLNP